MEKLITRKEAAEILGISIATLDAARNNGLAYKMKYEALKRQGKRSDLTSCQVGKKLAAEEVSQNTGDSSRQILRYIHLTELVAELLELADEKKLPFNTENIPYVDPGGIHLIRKMRNSSMKGTAIVGSGIFPGLSGWMLSSVLKEAFNDDLIEMIIGGVYNFSKAAAIDYVEEIKSYKAGIPMACVRNGKILPAQKRSPLNLPTRISKLSILPYVTEEIQEIIQGKYMLNIDSYTAAPVSLFSIVNKAHCQKKDLVNALMGQKNSNQKAFIWVRQNKGNDSRCIYFEGKNPSVLTGEILAITANAIFEMPRKDGIYTMASYLEKYQVLDELKKIDKFKSEGKI